MKPIELARLNAISRPQAGTVTRITDVQPATDVRRASQDAAAPGVTVTRSATAGDSAPVNSERVEQIRKSIEKGQYPLIPSEIADAMIAAKYLLRTK